MIRKSEYRRLGLTAVLVAVGVTCGVAAALPAFAQSTTDVNARLRRIERDILDLQAETFGKGARPDAAAAAAAPPAPEPPVAQPQMDFGPMMRRLDELEASVTRLTGQMEELGHNIDQLTQKADRLQKDMEFQANQRANNQPNAPSGAPSDARVPPMPNALASAAPPPAAPPAPGVLGQIPAGSTLPTAPPPPPDPKREFDNAMNLLSRAQYDQASAAFRKFADGFPDDERASSALYWTGDIAYSAKKDYEKAARDFAELLKKYPKAPRAPDSMLKLGLSLFGLGQMKEGCAALAALPAKYPDASPAITTRARNERRAAMCA